MKVLTQYITRQVLVTLLFALAVFTLVLLLGGALQQLSALLVNRRLGPGVVGTFLLLMLPYLLSFTLPMALLASVLLVFGRLSADHEITAMRASGVSLTRVAAPVVLLGLWLSAFCFYLQASVAPWCSFRIRMLPLTVSTSRPLAFLEPGTYIKDFPGYVLYIGRSRSNAVEDVVVHVLDDKGNMTSTLRARRAEVTVQAEERKLLLELQDVRGDLHDQADPTNIQKIRTGATASRYPLVLDLKPMYEKALASRKLSDLVLTELLDEIRSLQRSGIHPAAALLEAHKRVSAAAACVAFVLIGIPLGITTSRRETTVGLAVSLGLVTLYYFMTVLAGTLRDHPHLYPELILWTPNLVFQGLGLWLLWRLNRT